MGSRLEPIPWFHVYRDLSTFLPALRHGHRKIITLMKSNFYFFASIHLNFSIISYCPDKCTSSNDLCNNVERSEFISVVYFTLLSYHTFYPFVRIFPLFFIAIANVFFFVVETMCVILFRKSKFIATVYLILLPYRFANISYCRNATFKAKHWNIIHNLYSAIYSAVIWKKGVRVKIGFWYSAWYTSCLHWISSVIHFASVIRYYETQELNIFLLIIENCKRTSFERNSLKDNSLHFAPTPS